MVEKDFILNDYSELPSEGVVKWKAPSNIALVKYWGKLEHQIPANPSISFTLNKSATTTSVSFEKIEHPSSEFSFDLFFEGKPKDEFKPKIEVFLRRIQEYVPFLKDCHFQIETSNSFPHSSGIASSASGMAALALCMMEIEKLGNPKMGDAHFLQKASFLARLGSGSASRSIKGNIVQWGQYDGIEGSTNLYGIPYPYEVHPTFKKYQDTILLVHKGQKKVSSTLGHGLMKGHPFAENRFEQAHQNLHLLKAIFKEGNVEEFIKIVESEALTLHAMMMSSMPYFVLMQPNTLAIINKIWEFRNETGVPVCFTLDAGANVHLLYPEKEKEASFQFIKDELVAYCENGHYISDSVGDGAEKLIV